MSKLKDGLYDQLITRTIRESLLQQAGQGQKSTVQTLEDADTPDYLVRHLIRQIKSALKGVKKEDRQQRQIELANSILEFVQQQEDQPDPSPIDPPAEILRALYSSAQPPKPPTTPLSATVIML